DQATGATGVINLAIGERSIDNDAGIADPGTASLGNFVFLDANGNGVFDGADTAVGGVAVDLLDVDGLVLDSTTTDANGAYLFDELDAGIYSVRFTAPSGLEFTAAATDAADATNNDSDADETTGVTGQVDLSIGEAERDVDAGLIVTDTGDASLTGRVFMDSDDDDQDNGEMGVGGVLVTLTNAAGAVLDTTTTAADGSYSFTGLDAGDYVVVFPTEIADKILVDQNVGPDATDSDADQATGATGVINLAIGERSIDNDAGIKDPGTDENGLPGGSMIAAADDAAIHCADETVTVDVLANDSSDASALEITEVDGQEIAEGETIDVDGIAVTLFNGALIFDGKEAFTDLDFGETETVSVSYTITDAAGGNAMANVALTVKGVPETVAELYATLPTTGEYQILGGDLEGEIEDDGYTLILNGTGDSRFDGMVFERAYCISLLDPVIYAQVAADAPSFTGEISSGDNTGVFNANQISFANGKAAGENLDLIHWILNQDFVNDPSGRFNDWEVQRAIWELTDAFDTKNLDNADVNYGQDKDVDYIIDLAIENGEGFVAGQGDIATFIVDPEAGNPDNTQPFIVAFDFDAAACNCPEKAGQSVADVSGENSQGNDETGSPINTGEAGTNLLFGGPGIDRMAGGTDEDVFVFSEGTDLDIVYDYEDGVDQIGLDGIVFADVSIETYRGTDTVIQAGDDRMILRNVDAADLTVSDFVEL
ncbi:MAG: SdrD B-like domain-containing protein, partial [Pseudomonadota bacterium]